MVANTYLEGTYSERYPHVSQDADGLRRLFRQFSFPAGSRATRRPRRPGSIHEGGELGYALAHAYGAAFDNPDLLVACVIGDGEAETGPLATAWHSNKFLNPVDRRGGAADPPSERLQDREPDRPGADRPRRSWRACSPATATGRTSWRGTSPRPMHRAMAATLDAIVEEIRAIQTPRGRPAARRGPGGRCSCW